MTTEIFKLPIEIFIKNFRTKYGEFDSNAEGSVSRMFTDAFCYYFARILEMAYPGGKLCQPWPIGHFIYEYEGKCYDIDGEYVLEQHDCECAIPLDTPYYVSEDCIEHYVSDYLHCVDFERTKIEEFNTYIVCGEKLDKHNFRNLVYLIYCEFKDLNHTDEEDLKTLKFYWKWTELEDVVKLKKIAKHISDIEKKRINQKVNMNETYGITLADKFDSSTIKRRIAETQFDIYNILRQFMHYRTESYYTIFSINNFQNLKFEDWDWKNLGNIVSIVFNRNLSVDQRYESILNELPQLPDKGNKGLVTMLMTEHSIRTRGYNKYTLTNKTLEYIKKELVFIDKYLPFNSSITDGFMKFIFSQLLSVRQMKDNELFIYKLCEESEDR